MEEEIGLDYVK